MDAAVRSADSRGDGCGGAELEPAGALPTDGAARAYAAGINASGVIYALGGTPWQNGGDRDGAVHRLVAGVWEPAVPLGGMGPVISGAAGVDGLGRIILYGGFIDGDDGPGGDKVYDPVEGPSTSIAARPAPADAVGYFAWAVDGEGRLYGFGGGPGPGGPNLGYCDRYDAADDSWTVLAPLPTPVADACAAYDGAGGMLVIGGINAAGDARVTNVARYDIASDTWSDTLVPDLPVALSGARAALGADGRVYVLGGETGPIGAGVTQSAVYRLNRPGNQWNSAATMSTPRKWFACALGSDDCIYAVGGENDAGGTNLAEKLFTHRCPTITQQPAVLLAWQDSLAGFRVEASGAGPFGYQWRRDGQALSDGPTPWGSVISGAAAATLTIYEPVSDDAGIYDVEITNQCGSTLSDGVALTLRTPPAIPQQWQAISVHPAWAQNSSHARGIGGGLIGGYANTPTVLPDGRTFQLDHPVVWDTELFAAQEVTPPGSVGGGVYDVEGSLLVGWFWHTWQCWSGGQYWTCAWQSAGYWTAPTFDFVEAVHSSGAEYDYIAATDGERMVGTLAYEISEGFYDLKAHLWTATGGTWSLHFASASDTLAAAIDGPHQFGLYYEGAAGSRAVMWTDTPGSHRDVHPAGYSSSLISGAGDGQAVGAADSHAGLWVTDVGFAELHPASAATSAAVAAHQGIQCGSAAGRAALWSGSAASFFDLGAYVPEGFTSSAAEDFDVAGDGTITVVGYGYNTATGRTEALVWRSLAGIPGDLNGDGHVDFADLVLLLADYGCVSPPAADCPGDIDGDRSTGFGDLVILLSNYGR